MLRIISERILDLDEVCLRDRMTEGIWRCKLHQIHCICWRKLVSTGPEENWSEIWTWIRVLKYEFGILNLVSESCKLNGSSGDGSSKLFLFFFFFGGGGGGRSWKYLGIILCSDLRWAYQVNYTVRSAWKA
jgi:hypothetical protein